MAIQKQKNLANGASGNYWKITKIVADRISLRCEWIISLFKDKATADSSKVSLGIEKPFSCSLTKLELDGNLTALGYEKIKEISERPAVNIFNGHQSGNLDEDLANGEDV